MTFSLYELLLIIGLTQGITTSVLLLITKKNPLSNRILAAGVLSFCLLTAKMLLNSFGLSDTVVFRYLPIAIQLAIPPLMYMYLVSLLRPTETLMWKNIIHFIPFIVVQIFVLCVYMNVRGISSIAQQDQVANLLMYGPVKLAEDYLTLLSIAAYLGTGFIKLTRYRQNVSETLSDSRCPTFNSLFRIFVLSTILGVFLLLNMTAEVMFNLSEFTSIHWQVYFVYISFLIYYLGFVGYKQPHLEVPRFEVGSKVNGDKHPEKRSKKQLAKIIKTLEDELHNKKAYLNPTINSLDLAKVLDISQGALSFAINKHYKKTFRELINELRVQEVKVKLIENHTSSYSILSTALDCGFNSEASFYRIFKKQEGLAPRAYMRKLAVMNASLAVQKSSQ